MGIKDRRVPSDDNREEFDELLRDYGEEADVSGADMLIDTSAGMIESLDEETLALSQRFQAIVSYVSFLSDFFDAILKEDDDKKLEDALDTVSQGASALAKRYGSADSVIIRYRGRSSLESGEAAHSHDFTVQTGRTLLD
ncbi:MAG: hypothetical protein OEY50_08905, partial [Nitrospinota bacterium]|nr:hypothetical protein [Nitrospinota bacterium]